MRTIKFRAWDKESKMFKVQKMLMGAHGGDCFQVDGINFNNMARPEVKTMNICKEDCKYESSHCSLMQFTGLLDSKGKEIYDGDVLKYLPHYPADFQERNPHKKYGRILGPVVWVDGWIYADLKKDNGIEDILLYKECSEEFEIIGNVYENPELIKK